ncbi:MAG: Glutamyl-tRNA synthetase [Candidatus Giovannonibacteria bacterium GW2011_GWA2_53_7]|uniref:Glutamyl-tRNA synthetase n=1 Tax=Candidatus Giovannonibacteria bacterium GW2011_GWA2_53_7 TaxID=1618650 RepID=A0A0G1XYK3_9BACT|nr:MAG: Glutamyl-tRNA synthetase [Candidatus Giovannonibacteria bacterium GW2011_GWA2_53_7]
MHITHVIRGEDHISNTPRQILIQEALGYERPLYAHFPLHLAADRSKLSKRKGDVAVRSYREKGFLPEAIFNYLAMLGWTPPSQKEIMTIDEMIAEFDLHDLHRSAAVFDLEKLRWFNRQYVERMNEDDFTAYALPVFKRMIEERGVGYDETIAQKLVPLLRERISVPDDIGEMVAEGEFDFFFAEPKLDVARIPEKKSTTDEACEHLAYARQTLADISGWSPEAIKQALWEYASEKGRGAVLWPLRYALSGRDKSPDPFLIASIIGRDRTLKRIEHALASTSQ